MEKSDAYCVMPHLGVAVQNHSDFCCCNVNKLSWQNEKREVIFVHSHPINKSYQSHTRKIIAAALDNGIKHASCKFCWDLESAAAQSPRQTFNQIFSDVEPIPTQPRVLIIKPGNTCNFACRMCNPITSSSWYADGYELEKMGLTSSSWYNEKFESGVEALSFNEYTQTFETIRNSFNRDNTEFWETLKDWISNLIFIDIYGGEPFLIPAMFDLLQHGVDIGANKNIELRIHTNASIWNEKYVKILSQYKKVSLLISIDAVDSMQLEYIRHRANFDTVMEHTKRFIQIFKNSANVKLNINYTVTPLNVYYSNEIIEELKKMFDLSIGVTIVTTPEYDIRHLPLPVKQQMITRIKNTEINNFLQQTIPGCDVEWPKFCRTTNKLDQLRNQSFAKTFPEWWTFLEPYWIS